MQLTLEEWKNICFTPARSLVFQYTLYLSRVLLKPDQVNTYQIFYPVGKFSKNKAAESDFICNWFDA
jgi:hypothetical protein